MTVDTLPLRLHPGADLKAELAELGQRDTVRAGIILTAVGSLSHAELRFADCEEGTSLPGPWEIIALSGTLSPEGLHLHAALADGEGRVVGGHVLDGCRVYTTVELVVGVLEGWRFGREHDPATGYRELNVSREGP